MSAAAAREVLEETGYAREIVQLCTTGICAYLNARRHIYLMRNGRQVAAPEMAPSDLSRVAEIARVQFEAVVRSCSLTDLDAGMVCLDRIDRDQLTHSLYCATPA